MTLAAAWVLALVVVAVVLFMMDRLPSDLIGLMVLGLLLVTRTLTPEDAFAGFSNSATVTVAAMFILSAGLWQTGALVFAGRWLARLAKRSQHLALLLLLVVAGAFSAFLNNTAVMAIFLPIALDVSRSAKMSASKLLMPLSFTIICGGLCTLIGSSANILASSIGERNQVPALRLFEQAPIGLALLGVTIAYFALGGTKLLPERRAGELTESFELRDYVTELVLLDPAKADILDGLEVLAVYREKRWLPAAGTQLRQGDQLRVLCGVEKLKQLRSESGVELRSDLKLQDADFGQEDRRLIEAVVAPNSEFDGASLKSIGFFERFGAKVLALRHRGQVLHEKTSKQILRGGDTLLIEAGNEAASKLTQDRSFILLTDADTQPQRIGKRKLSLIIVLSVIVLASTNVLPMVTAATLGCLAMVLTKCLSLTEAYTAIQWKVIFLLGSITGLGIALEKTGAADVLSWGVVSALGNWGPMAVLAGLLLLATALTEAMSNNAVVALITPVAIAAAKSLDADPKPFVLAMMIGSSLCMVLPAGYQTNMMIVEPGRYRVLDFARAGGPLKLLLLATTLLMLMNNGLHGG